MNEERILEELTFIIRSIIPNVEISEKTALVGDHILDSLEFMNYIVKVEQKFNVKITDAEISQKSLGKISNMVKHIAKQM